MDKYKHITDTSFPNVSNVDVFAYKNTFDYTRWDIDTEIRLLDVPWDGDVNAIKWNSDADRDKWIDSHTAAKYILDTEQYLQPDGSIKLPIPFNVACLYNYISIKYPKAPIAYEDDKRLERYFYFITNTKQLAPSTTECTLMLDAWTTYQNQIDISYFMLERGHAPMAMIKAADYIEDPLNNAGTILAPDVNFAGSPSGGWVEAKQYVNLTEWIANDDNMYVVIAMSGQAGGDWGTSETDSMHVPATIAPTFFGGLGYDYIAMRAQDSGHFFDQMFIYRPQMAPTIAAIFYVPGKLIDLANYITLFDVRCYFFNTNSKKFNLLKLDLDMFGYQEKYKYITKLYTYPYVYIEITDEKGEASIIPVEGTHGSIDIAASLNLFAPFLGLDVMPINIYGTEKDVDFALSGNRTMRIGGGWNTLIRHWDIPTYSVFQDQRSSSKYNRYFENKQAETARDNAFSSAVASTTTARDNTARSTNTAYWNAEDGANASYDTSQTAKNLTQYSTAEHVANNNEQFALAAKSNWANTAGTMAAQGLSQYLSADNSGIAVASTVAQGAMNAGITGAMAGGPTGAVVGAAAGAMFSGVTQMATQSNNQNYMSAIGGNQNAVFDALYGGATGYDAEFGINYYLNNYGGASSESINGKITAQTNTLNNNISTGTQNATQANANTNKAATLGGNGSILTTNGTIGSGTTFYGTAKRSQETGHTNNTATYNTGIANANRAADTATKAIDRGNRAQWATAPDQIGYIANAGTASSRPMGLFVNLVKQSETSLAQAGDAMLRWGYMLHASWPVDDLQVMRYYTYWKAEDLWLKIDGEASAPKRDATESIKDMFKNGITIWSNPDAIGHVSIYDNLEA